MVDEEIKVGEALEKQVQQEEQQEVKQALAAEGQTNWKDDGKGLLWLLIIVVGVFILFIGGFQVYNKITAAEVVDINQLHQENLQGDLSEKEGYLYNGFSFVFTDGLWWTDLKINEGIVRIPLHFGPKEVEEIKFQGYLNNTEFNSQEELFLTINPLVRDKYYSLALSELSFNIAKGIDRTPIGACTEENYACENRTIISCENNSQHLPVIELALDNKTSITYQGSCIKIAGEGYDLVKAADRILYQWYGVMKKDKN